MKLQSQRTKQEKDMQTKISLQVDQKSYQTKKSSNSTLETLNLEKMLQFSQDSFEKKPLLNKSFDIDKELEHNKMIVESLNILKRQKMLEKEPEISEKTNSKEQLAILKDQFNELYDNFQDFINQSVPIIMYQSKIIEQQFSQHNELLDFLEDDQISIQKNQVGRRNTVSKIKNETDQLDKQFQEVQQEILKLESQIPEFTFNIQQFRIKQREIARNIEVLGIKKLQKYSYTNQ